MQRTLLWLAASLSCWGCAVAETQRADARANTPDARNSQDVIAPTMDAMDDRPDPLDSGVAMDARDVATDTVIDSGATICGNGRLEAGEQCDDGNRVDTDGCRNSCQLARCGDGVVRTNIEECDDGNTAPNDGCTTACVQCAGADRVEDPRTGSCFRREESLVDFDTARASCEGPGDEIAVFDDAAQWDVVRPALIDGRASVWLGATDRAAEGTWQWNDGSPMVFSAWAAGEPNDSEAAEDCVEAGSQWNDLNCVTPRGALCQRRGWTVRPTDGHAYRLWLRASNYSDAASACSAIGAHLVTLSNASERSFVRTIARGSTVWIGLDDRASEGTFRWVNGEPLDEVAWSAGEPNNSGGDEDCTQALPNDQWNDLACTALLPFVCERE